MANQDVDYHALDAKASNGGSGRDFDYQLPSHTASGVESAVDDLLTAIDDHEPATPPPVARPAPPAPQIRPAPVPATPVQMTNAMPATQPPPVKQPTAAQLARGSHLYAGQGIKLKGEISDCETFTVEGDVEAQLSAKQLLLASSGTFRGTAVVEEAQIEGQFEGELHVTGRLLLRSSGRAAGTISYGQIEIERGGQLHGHIAPYVKPQPQPAPVPKRPSADESIMQRAVEQRPARAPEPARASAYQAPPPPKMDVKPVEPPKPAPEAKKRSTFFGGFRPTTP